MGILSFFYKYYIKYKEKSFGKLRYLYIKNHSDSLLVVFSGFSPGNVRKYNYIKSFRKLNIDKLFVLDTYAYKGSYYLFEGGSDYPQKEVQSLLNRLLSKHHYRNTYYAGSSKGGSAALFYGIQNNATKVFCGACQYNLGDYLSKDKHREILLSMMGDDNLIDSKYLLNNVLKNTIIANKHSTSAIYLLYSRSEPTYEEEIVDLKRDLQDNGYIIIEKEEHFTDHGEVGKYFPAFVIENLAV